MSLLRFAWNACIRFADYGLVAWWSHGGYERTSFRLGS